MRRITRWHPPLENKKSHVAAGIKHYISHDLSGRNQKRRATQAINIAFLLNLFPFKHIPHSCVRKTIITTIATEARITEKTSRPTTRPVTYNGVSRLQASHPDGLDRYLDPLGRHGLRRDHSRRDRQQNCSSGWYVIFSDFSVFCLKNDTKSIEI